MDIDCIDPGGQKLFLNNTDTVESKNSFVSHRGVHLAESLLRVE